MLYIYIVGYIKQQCIGSMNIITLFMYVKYYYNFDLCNIILTCTAYDIIYVFFFVLRRRAVIAFTTIQNNYSLYSIIINIYSGTMLLRCYHSISRDERILSYSFVFVARRFAVTHIHNSNNKKKKYYYYR